MIRAISRGLGAVALSLVLGCVSPTERGRYLGIDPQGWIELQSPSFTMATNGSEADLRKLGGDLGRFVAVVKEVMTLEGRGSGLPMRIHVFREEREYFAAGGPTNSGGFARGTFDGVDLLLPMARHSTMTRVALYHEFVHYLLARHGRVYPLWYHEGLAEMMSTLQIRDGAVAIGFPPPHRKWELASDELLPLEVLLEATSTHTMDPEKAGLFYAQSWALVHYLHGPKREQLVGYLTRLREGIEWRTAFALSFDVSLAELELELSQYWLKLRQGVRFMNRREPVLDFESEWLIGAMSEFEAARMLSQLQLVRGPKAAAHAVPYLRRAIEHEPARAPLHAALAWGLALEGDAAGASASLAEAQRLDPKDADVWLYAGRVATVDIDRAEAGERLAAIATARSHFERSTELDPERAVSFAELGLTYLYEEASAPEDIASGLRALGAAAELGGADAHVEIGLGVLHLRAGDSERAIPHLRRAAHFAHNTEISEEAQELLDALSEAE